MAELATIARPYAEALFRVAKAGSLAAWSDLVSEMAQVAAHPEIKALAQNPSVSHAKLAEVFAAAVKTPLSVEAQNFVKTLADNGRLTLLPQIAEQFHELKNAQEGSADAHIVSAFEMSDAQVKDVISTLEKKFGRKLNPSVKVDGSLIGGVRVVVGDEVFDTSVRAKLQQLHAALAA
ncbi:F0F1 ATP synthase subunit delta [Herbaspirillum sp.]|uniref:F0F1 ATP synthase subunit delta n=1 Tax=Herbaspirillum sp. TaxID=1890675 RepID=UPI001B18F4B4|nr:F0F1 ATP synthase subunit delta [Herbaspirillum sp.]MBO9536396.1 F0F1 ATP synthase subunit delta [Herbaspirillum sp.]